MYIIYAALILHPSPPPIPTLPIPPADEYATQRRTPRARAPARKVIELSGSEEGKVAYGDVDI